MVLEEISQLIEDCNSKREALTTHREAINQAQKDLLRLASKRLEKDDLTDLEHYQNQFHIQLINIHDLKHDLRAYEHRLKVESHLHDGVSNETIQKHSLLSEEFDSLENTLNDLQSDFQGFIEKPH